MATQKTQYYLTEQAVALIDAHAPSPNKRGEWVSAAVVAYAQQLEEDLTEECGTLEQMAALLRRIERRIMRLDSKIAPSTEVNVRNTNIDQEGVPHVG